jgi:hypothetical protein
MSTATASTTADTVTRDRLRGRLREITGRVLAEVRVTRVQWTDDPRWCVLALTVEKRLPFGRREVPLADGDHHREIAELLKRAFPHADWDRAQDYDVATGFLTEHVTVLPDCLRGDAL